MLSLAREKEKQYSCLVLTVALSGALLPILRKISIPTVLFTTTLNFTLPDHIRPSIGAGNSQAGEGEAI